MAMASNERRPRSRSRRRSRKVNPAEVSDSSSSASSSSDAPSHYTEECISTKIHRDGKEISSDAELDDSYFIDIKSQVVKSLRRGYADEEQAPREGSDDESSGEEGDEYSYVSDEAASKRAMHMMLRGEHPDTEIDRLLESFGI